MPSSEKGVLEIGCKDLLAGRPSISPRERTDEESIRAAVGSLQDVQGNRWARDNRVNEDEGVEELWEVLR